MSLSKRMRFDVLKRDGFRCVYCGAVPPAVVLQVDHVIAKSKGGPDSMDNLVTSCQPCNSGKSDVLIGPMPETPGFEERKKIAVELHIKAEKALAARRKLDSAVELLCGYCESVFGDEFIAMDKYELNAFPRFLKRISFEEIIDAVDIVFQNKNTWDFFYFCGVCWRKVNEPETRKYPDLKPEFPDAVKSEASVVAQSKSIMPKGEGRDDSKQTYDKLTDGAGNVPLGKGDRLVTDDSLAGIAGGRSSLLTPVESDRNAGTDSRSG